MRTRSRNAIVLMVAAAVLVAGLVQVARTRSDHALHSVGQAIPASALAVFIVDLRLVRSSPYAKLVEVGGLLHAWSKGVSSCEQNILQQVDQLAVWLPAAAPDDFAVAALTRGELGHGVECAREAISRRGGNALVREEHGGRLVSDASLGDSSAMVLFKSPGLILLGRQQTRGRMLAALANPRETALAQGIHQELRKMLGTDVAVVATATLTHEHWAWLKQRLGYELSVETLTAVGFAMTLSDLTHLRVVARCNDATACTRLASQTEEWRQSVAASLPLRASGIAGLLDNAKVTADGTSMTLEARAPTDQVLQVVERITRWADDTSPTVRPTGSAPSHDAIIRADTSARPGSSQ